MSGAATSHVTAEERQFSLMLALIDTRTGYTKRELFERVRGYAGRRVDDALERQFERDKDDLRDLGIELDVFTPPGDGDNNQDARYRVSDRVLGSPDELEFTPEERGLIDLALRVWTDGGFTEESQRAALKLRADPEFRTGMPSPVVPVQRAREQAFDELKRACDRGRVVRFDYVKPGETTATHRRVEAWSVLLFRDRWMLHGFDLDAGATRTFLMRRIVGRVTARAPQTPFAVPEGAAEAALAELERIWASATARVRVLPGSDAEVRLAKRRDTVVDGDVLTLHHADANLLADELAGFGPDVVVLEPQRLRELVVARLERIRDAHEGVR